MRDGWTDGFKNVIVVAGNERDGAGHSQAALEEIENHDEDMLRLSDEQRGG